MVLLCSEVEARETLQRSLERLAPGRFECVERKTGGLSAINKAVDLEIRERGRTRPAVAVEVANVNSTQLVGEVCRLYYDALPFKVLVLGPRNVPADGKAQCEALLCRLYGQQEISGTPARVMTLAETDLEREKALKDLLWL